MIQDHPILTALTLVLGFWLYRRWTKSPYASLPLPPGPKPLPVIGNILDIPSTFVWETYHKWYKEFDSDILYVTAGGTSLVILTTYEAAVELLDKRSAIYSSRVRLPMANELMGWSFNFGFMPYGETWRAYRRVFHEYFNAHAIKEFEPQIVKAANQLLLRLVNKPGDIIQQFRHMAGYVILSIAYGIPVLEEHDPHVALAEEAIHLLCVALLPGTFLVDALPFLKHVPSWFPGAGFRRKAKEWNALTQNMIGQPFQVAKARISTGKFSNSFSSNALSRIHEENTVCSDEETIKAIAGGADTTVSALSTFAYAMIKYPEVQRKAQEELDRVIKPGHLPTLEDRDSLPYLDAVLKEVLRWKAVTPIGLPHCSTAEDVYKGYRIPAGSIVIAHTWSMFLDEEMYPDPETFNPDRYFTKDGKLNPDVRDPTLIAFGFGRRICPGRFMAQNSIWLNMACILSTMNIAKAVDENGVPKEPSGEYESALVHILKPFPCSVTPRSKEAVDLIQSTALVHDYA